MAAFTPREVIAILKQLGYVEKRQTGSHLILYQPQKRTLISVPVHARDVKKGLLRSIIKQVNLRKKSSCACASVAL